MKTTVWKWHVLLGGNSNSFDAFLLHQGIKTLELRMNAHCENAALVANLLHDIRRSTRNYTGLPSHPQYEIASKQMYKHPPLISFELKGGLEPEKFYKQIKYLC